METHPQKLIVFSSLFKSQMGAIKDLLVLLGKGEKASLLDKIYQKKKFFGPWGLQELGQLYKGFSKDKLESLALSYSSTKLVDGLRETIVELKKQGFLIGALSSNPQFLMDTLKKKMPLDFSFGTQLDFSQKVANGRLWRELNRYGKAEILRKKREEYRLRKEDIILIGKPTITHLPMIKEAGVFIGFDPITENILEIIKSLRNQIFP